MVSVCDIFTFSYLGFGLIVLVLSLVGFIYYRE
jgi:hypothetical protein